MTTRPLTLLSTACAILLTGCSALTTKPIPSVSLQQLPTQTSIENAESSFAWICDGSHQNGTPVLSGDTMQIVSLGAYPPNPRLTRIAVGQADGAGDCAFHILTSLAADRYVSNMIQSGMASHGGALVPLLPNGYATRLVQRSVSTQTDTGLIYNELQLSRLAISGDSPRSMLVLAENAAFLVTPEE